MRGQGRLRYGTRADVRYDASGDARYAHEDTVTARVRMSGTTRPGTPATRMRTPLRRACGCPLRMRARDSAFDRLGAFMTIQMFDGSSDVRCKGRVATWGQMPHEGSSDEVISGHQWGQMPHEGSSAIIR